jgi:hypothetical protein
MTSTTGAVVMLQHMQSLAEKSTDVRGFRPEITPNRRSKTR